MLTHIVFQLFVCILVCQRGSIGFMLPTDKPPQIWLHTYKLKDPSETQSAEERSKTAEASFRAEKTFKNDFISKNSTDYTISGGVAVVIFFCESTYPIAWSFPHLEQASKIYYQSINSEYLQTSEFSSTSASPLKTRYVTSIRFYLDNGSFLNVNLTCKSLEGSNSKSSIHIFYDGYFKLENNRQTIQVNFPPRNDESIVRLIIPCRPATPDIFPILQKERSLHNGTKEWIPLDVHVKSIAFDSKVGFIIDHSKISFESGLYRCSVSTSEPSGPAQYVRFNVTESPSTHDPQEDFSPISNLSENARVDPIRLTNNSNLEDLPCCSGFENERPTLVVRYCFSQIQCDIVRSNMIKSFDYFKKHNGRSALYGEDDKDASQLKDCSGSWINSPSAFVVCQGKSVDFQEQFVNLFNPGLNGAVVKRRQLVWENLQKVAKTVENSAMLPPTKPLPVTLYKASSNLASEKMVIVSAAPLLNMDAMSETRVKSSIDLSLEYSEDQIESEHGIYYDSVNSGNVLNNFLEYPRVTSTTKENQLYFHAWD